MRSPILKQGEVLIASVQASLTDTDLIQLRKELLAEVQRNRVSGVIVDVTLLDVMDSFSARTLRDTAHAITLLGAQAIVVGIQPEVAFAMVQLGLQLQGAVTALDLDEGLAMLKRGRARRRSRNGK